MLTSFSNFLEVYLILWSQHRVGETVIPVQWTQKLQQKLFQAEKQLPNSVLFTQKMDFLFNHRVCFTFSDKI